ncbi:MAG: hypothetical protein N3F03_03755 [Ignavibacteria bacterium]|nr:hypothetical protein [Ignavibacteria bacterium]
MFERVKEHLKNYWFGYLLFSLGLYFISIRGTYTFIDFIDLLIHEPGHLIFGLFGNFIQFLGGTLMQILLPLSMAIIFFIKGNKYWTQIFLFWLGHNFINISVYVDDANKMKLRIIGGVHDWNWILNKIGMIEFAEELGLIFVGLSFLTFLILIFVPYFLVNVSEEN